MDDLKSQFQGEQYNLMTKNCNHFSEALATRLLNKPFPGYVNRLANLGGMVSCLIPPSLLGDAPVDQQGGNGGATAGSSYQVIAPRNRQTPQTGAVARTGASLPGGGGFSGAGMKLGKHEICNAYVNVSYQ